MGPIRQHEFFKELEEKVGGLNLQQGATPFVSHTLARTEEPSGPTGFVSISGENDLHESDYTAPPQIEYEYNDDVPFSEEFGAKALPRYGPGKCEHCGSAEGVTVVGAMTAYDTTKWNRWEHIARQWTADPNDSSLLCTGCAKEYTEHWNDMWEDHYRNCW